MHENVPILLNTEKMMGNYSNFDMNTATKCGIKLYIFQPEHDKQELSVS